MPQLPKFVLIFLTTTGTSSADYKWPFQYMLHRYVLLWSLSSYSWWRDPAWLQNLALSCVWCDCTSIKKKHLDSIWRSVVCCKISTLHLWVSSAILWVSYIYIAWATYSSLSSCFLAIACILYVTSRVLSPASSTSCACLPTGLTSCLLDFHLSPAIVLCMR